MTPTGTLPCPICAAGAALLDVVDFNKSCEEPKGKFLPLSGRPVYYALCDNCGFAFAPELYAWPEERFLRDIYNDDYIDIDPDYVETRPLANASLLRNTFDKRKAEIRHLDFGGGAGRLSEGLSAAGWDSRSYDPFPGGGEAIEDFGRFNLITAFEVFEHVPDVWRLMRDLGRLADDSCLILFSTLLSDGQIHKNSRLSWWYASPRNGHISLFSRRSLEIVAEKSNLNLKSFNAGFHALFNTLPAWVDIVTG